MRFFIFCLCFLYFYTPVQAQQRISYLLDSETTHYFKEISAPFLPHQNLKEEDLTFFLVNSKEINAFVTPQRDIYMYSGLVLKAKSVSEVQGVLAHEIGHLLGHHHAKRQANAGQNKNTVILGTLAGIGAMLAGAPEAGTAIALGSQAALISSILKYSRTQEREADRIAITLLHKKNYSVSGLYDFFKKLRGDELLYVRTSPEYLLTHPLTSNRLQLMQDIISTEKNKTPFQEKRFERIQAKIYAMTHTPMQTLRKFRENTDPHIYAQSIAYALKGNSSKAEILTKQLIKNNPKDIYYQELMAQIYVDSGQLKKALPYFEAALNLGGGTNPLIRYQYGKNLLNLKKYKAALPHLLRVKEALPRWPQTWQSVGIAYGKQGMLTESHLALAEAALLKNNKAEAKIHIRIAEAHINKASTQTKQRFKLLNNFINEEEKK